MRDVPRLPAPPVAAVVSFIDAINRGDLRRLTELMDPHHALVVLAEEPLIGREANAEAWNGYFTSFPDYVIYPRHVVFDGTDVAVLGTTTGSHLGLPDDEESRLTVIWTAKVSEGLLTEWRIRDDSAGARIALGLPD